MSSQVYIVWINARSRHSLKDHEIDHRITDAKMDKTRAAYFSLMETYEEVKHICKKGNTAAVIKQRENAWQIIADRLNA